MTLNPKIEKAFFLKPEDEKATLLAILFSIGVKANPKLYIYATEELKELRELQLIKVENNKFSLKEELFVEITKQNKEIDKIINARVDELRAVFSKEGKGKVGLKPGSLGDREACIQKLKLWFRSHPNYSFDDVIKAAKYYVSTLKGNYTYMKQADYFIMKDKQSLLSAYIDESLDKDSEIISEDWTFNFV